jgi:ankyrin repeat protein
MNHSELHHVSIWEPGDEAACGYEHVAIASNGNIMCYEDHDIELELTIADLGVADPNCFFWMDYADHGLSNAAERLDLAEIKFALAAGADIHFRKDQAVLWAIESVSSIDSFPVIQYLIDQGADINTNHKIARAAAVTGMLTLQLLFDNGLQDKFMDGAIESCVWGDRIDVLKFILINKKPSIESLNKTLNTAATADRIDMVLLLIEHGASIDAIKDPINRTVVRRWVDDSKAGRLT